MITYRSFPPSDDLADIVQGYYVFDVGEECAVNVLVPDGAPEMIFTVRGGMIAELGDRAFRAASVVVGQIPRAARAIYDRDTVMFWVKLQPWAPSWLFGLPGHRLLGEAVEISSLPETGGWTRLARAIAASESPGVAIEAVEHHLRRLLRERPPADAIARRGVRDIEKAGPITVGDLGARYGVTSRHLQRKFHEHVGLSPQLFARVVRVKRLAHQLADGRLSLADAAFAGNYFDQSHFIRDFRGIVGMPPSEFLRAAASLPVRTSGREWRAGGVMALDAALCA